MLRPPPTAFDAVSSPPTLRLPPPVGIICLGDVLVAAGKRHAALYADRLYVAGNSFSWVSGVAPEEVFGSGGLRCWARVRHGLPLVRCTVRLIEKVSPKSTPQHVADLRLASTGQEIEVSFEEPQRALTAGQVVALYVDGPTDMLQSAGLGEALVCLGGGPILDVAPSYWDQGRPLPFI